MKQPQVELLAPASGLEAIRAAIFAGADAVYTGGTRFGARAYADNLAEDELLQAIDFVHLHGKQLYLTVNTLLKERELEDSLVEYLKPYYERGLDAVIVQDIGVFQAVREHFPDLPVHVSTQAVVTGKNSAKFWEEMGAQRIVTARELSLDEIKTIRDNISIEIESFVHGALCYCYSGQCFYSSFVGGRSGNRGRCAQPCRLPYQLTDEHGNSLTKHSSGRGEQYLLSPKDMCTLDILPDIIEAGVFSLKIEGRMKRPEYTAGVTAIYRKYVDLYLTCKADVLKTGHQKDILSKIKERYQVSREDKELLMDLYNRGNFHSGYYTMHNGKEMMSMERPNHNGVYVGTMQKGKKGYSMKIQTDLHRQDVLEFRGVTDKHKTEKPLELTCERDVTCDSWYVLPDKYAFLLGKKQSVEVYRTKNEQLLQQLHKNYLEDNKAITINGRIVAEEGQPLVLFVTKDNLEIKVIGSIVESAQNQPSGEDYIRKQISKTGNTPFVFSQLEVTVTGNCFVPVKVLNQIRRDALEKLQTAMIEQYRRTYPSLSATLYTDTKDSITETDADNVSKVSKASSEPRNTSPRCHVFIEDLKHSQMLLQYEQIDAIYISIHAFSFLANVDSDSAMKQLQQIKEQCHQAKKDFYLVLPHIWRKTTEKKLTPYMEDILMEIDGIVVKNTEVLAFVNHYKSHMTDIDIVLDYSAYAMNSKAVSAWKEQGVSTFTLPIELNKGELTTLASNNNVQWEMLVYGHMPMMVSAQCPIKNTMGCQKKMMTTRLKDRKGSLHYVRNYCDTCYSVIYNSEPLVLTDLLSELKPMSLYAHRIQFSVETKEEILQVMEQYITGNQPQTTYTRGHWKRGVE